MKRTFALCLISVVAAFPAHAATLITFDDRPVGPSIFVDATPSPQTIIYPDATFTGGVILGNEANLPAQSFGTLPNVYGTANFGNGLSSTIGVSLTSAVSEISFPIFNGEGFSASYTANAFNASNMLVASQTLLNLASNSSGGFGIIDLQAMGIVRVAIGLTAPSSTFDFSIDSVALNQSVQTAFAVPGPIAGAGLVPLLGIAGAWFMRRRKQLAA